MRKLVFNILAALAITSNMVLYLIMVIYGNLLTRILSFIPCALLCGLTIMIILNILLNKATEKEKNERNL